MNSGFQEKAKEPWEEVFDIAETYHYGLDDEIVDYEEAMNYYLKAIKLGSVLAYARIGDMYSSGEGVNENKKKALQYFKEGAKKGDLECYAEMAKLFADQENIENSLKSWKKYFELAHKINFVHTIHYIEFIRNNNLELKYIDKIKTVLEKIIDWTSSNINEIIDSEYEILIPSYKERLRYYKEIQQNS